ncbi:MAG: SPFH domain-containing protein [Sphingomonadales bacterium]|nr:MAG: SPFH domain-containing protein [Sphingomonadales bacterium]
MSLPATLSHSSERPARGISNGIGMLLTLLAITVLIPLVAPRFPVLIVPLGIAWFVIVGGFFVLQPNQAAAILLFGAYRGTERTTGLRWVLPWYTRKKISVRVHNSQSPTMKVNDKRGNPVEIAVVVVWRVADTAQALFDVEDYKHFVEIQIESATRTIASQYPYDDIEHHEKTLRADADDVCAQLRDEIQARVQVAGVQIDEARLAHLAYAPEIAGAMLRRQQAEAVIAARAKLVEGAVTMVQSALEMLSQKGVVELDDERRAAMVSNLMVVLCGERETQPVVNTGTLYS